MGNIVIEKSEASDFKGRFREIISDPLNIAIKKVPLAGSLIGDNVVLHNGIVVPARGPAAYYDDFSEILILNSGVHEPLEEYVFQEVLEKIQKSPTMLELGAYWGHYSMWLKSVRPSATVYLVEPDELRLDSGKQNFERNNLQGNFVQAFVGKNQFDVDGFLDQNNIITLDILHADIQGYELEMLDGASSILSRYGAAYVFISTHSQLLHNSVIDRLKSIGYRIEVSADFDSETTSYDGFIFASRPDIDQVFSNWSPLGRLQLLNASPEIILDYITKTIRNI